MKLTLQITTVAYTQYISHFTKASVIHDKFDIITIRKISFENNYIDFE